MALNSANNSNAVKSSQQHSCLFKMSTANTVARMANRRELTDEERLWAANLKRIWEQKKESDGLSQLDAAVALGYKTQSAFSQFLLGTVPLHTDAKAKMARFLGVDVTEIDPGFYKRLGLSPTHLSPGIAEIADALAVLDKDDLDEILSLVQAKMKRRSREPPRDIIKTGSKKQG